MKDLTRALKANLKVKNMRTRGGSDAPNQFIITTDYGVMFRSYQSNIAFKPYDENVIYLGEDWDYSNTTNKYRNDFLGCNTAEVRQMLKDGRAKLVKDL